MAKALRGRSTSGPLSPAQHELLGIVHAERPARVKDLLCRVRYSQAQLFVHLSSLRRRGLLAGLAPTAAGRAALLKPPQTVNQPLPMPPLDDVLLARIDANIDKSAGPDDCWLWRGATVRGYGHHVIYSGARPRSLRVTRVMVTLATGRDPGPLLVRHSCDRPLCCNPAHLTVGTDYDNTMDAVKRGRKRPFARMLGESHPGAALSEATVRMLRAAYAAGTPLAPLARSLGINESTARLAAVGKTWRHVQ